MIGRKLLDKLENGEDPDECHNPQNDQFQEGPGVIQLHPGGGPGNWIERKIKKLVNGKDYLNLDF